MTRFIDPVMDECGCNFEYTAIVKWLEDHSTCPLTRQSILKINLRPNRMLRLMCESAKNDDKDDGDDDEKKWIDLNPLVWAVQANDDGLTSTVSVSAPDVEKAFPIDVVIVLDCSASMGANPSPEDRTTSILDVAIHAVRTVARTLRSCDRLGLVTYSTNAKLEVALSSPRPQMLDSVLLNISSTGRTNIWGGLECALKTMGPPTPGRNQLIMLQTDGNANIIPPRGECGMLKAWKRDRVGQLPTLHVFGFGTSQGDTMLKKLAEISPGGRYHLIFDVGMLATTLCNVLASQMAVVGSGPGFPCIQAGTIRTRIMQSKDAPKNVIAVVVAHELVTMTRKRQNLELYIIGLLARKKMDRIECEYQETMEQLSQAIASKKNFEEWGRRYMLTLLGALQMETCVNFKDECLQAFGGRIFRELRDDAEKVFNEMDALVTPEATQAINYEPVSYSRYNDVDAGCFVKGTLIHMKDAPPKPIEELKQGDILECGEQMISLFVFKEYSGRVCIVAEGVLVTPHHPIINHGNWVFPVDITGVKTIHHVAADVFNIFTTGGILLAGNDRVRCITLGHGLEGNVVSHPLFGNRRLIASYAVGGVTNVSGVERDPNTGLCVGYVQ
jgi:hypothetical protein